MLLIIYVNLAEISGPALKLFCPTQPEINVLQDL